MRLDKMRVMKNMTERKKTNRGGTQWRLVGQAGVWATASQLAIRGINPSFPGVDDGYDLILDTGIKIQVKSAHLIFQNARMYKQGVYSFDLRRPTFDPTKKSKQSSSVYRRYSDVADFFVLWGIDEDRFWIIPTTIKNKRIYFPRRNSIGDSMSTARHYWTKIGFEKEAAMENRWDLLDVGTTVEPLIDSVQTVAVAKE